MQAAAAVEQALNWIWHIERFTCSNWFFIPPETAAALKEINLLVTLLSLLSSLLLVANDIEPNSEMYFPFFPLWAYLRCISRSFSRGANGKILIWSNLINTCFCNARSQINNNSHKVKFNWILGAAKNCQPFLLRLFL